MNNELEVITKTYPATQNKLHAYAIGDVHVGSPQFNEKAIKKKIDIIKNDELACLCLLGDLGDFALRNSRSNIYQATMQPKEQVDYIYSLFYDVRDKIVCAVSGNHEERLIREGGGIDPLLTLCCRWGCEEVYRENMGIIKLAFGSIKGNVTGKVQQNVFYGLCIHGSTKRKNHVFQLGVEGCDFGFSAHVHEPMYKPNGKIRVSRESGQAHHVPYKEVVVDANLSIGGYGVKHQHEIPAPPELQYLELYTYRDNTNKRALHRVINYHTIQI